MFDIQKQCRVNEISYEVVGFCLQKQNNCSIPVIVDNLSKSVFKLTGAANKIVEIIVTEYAQFGAEDLSNLDAASTTFSDLG